MVIMKNNTELQGPRKNLLFFNRDGIFVSRTVVSVMGVEYDVGMISKAFKRKHSNLKIVNVSAFAILSVALFCMLFDYLYPARSDDTLLYVFGLCVLALYLTWIVTRKFIFCVMLETTLGTMDVITSDDEAMVDSVIISINKAVMSHREKSAR